MPQILEFDEPNALRRNVESIEGNIGRLRRVLQVLKLQFQLLGKFALRLVLVDLEALRLVRVRLQVVLIAALGGAVKWRL